MIIQPTSIIELNSNSDIIVGNDNKSIIINKLLKILESYNLIYAYYKNNKEENTLIIDDKSNSSNCNQLSSTKSKKMEKKLI